MTATAKTVYVMTYTTGYLETENEATGEVVGFSETTWEVEYEVDRATVHGNHEHPRELAIPYVTAMTLIEVEGRVPTQDEHHLLSKECGEIETTDRLIEKMCDHSDQHAR